jgi:hypothetical protein
MVLSGQFSTILLPVMPHLFLSSFLAVISPLFQLFRLFLVVQPMLEILLLASHSGACCLWLFVLLSGVPPASSPQYIGAAYFVGCITHPKLSVHYTHTHPLQKVWV